jgi:membrane protein implicated in regulation of membrane protease activity
MWHNEGTLDRWIRVLLGVGLIAVVFIGPQTVWGWFGLIPLITGVTGYCPLYSVTGWSTRHRPAQKQV